MTRLVETTGRLVRLTEHPGHSDQKVHGRRGGQKTLGLEAPLGQSDSVKAHNERVEDFLRLPVTITQVNGDHGVNSSFVGEIQGKRVFVKVEDLSELESERACQALNDTFGPLVSMKRLVWHDPDTVDWQGRAGGGTLGMADSGVLVQEWADGYKTPGSYWTSSGGRDTRAGEPSQMRDMALFDIVIANPDRHGGNLMVDAQNNVLTVDNSRAFWGRPASWSEGVPDHRVPYTPRQREFLQRIVDAGPDGVAKVIGQYQPGQAEGIHRRAKALLDLGEMPGHRDLDWDSPWATVLDEALLMEHPGHGSDKVHGNWARHRGGTTLVDLSQPLDSVERMKGGFENSAWRGTIGGQRVFVKEASEAEIQREVAIARLNELVGGFVNCPRVVVKPIEDERLSAPPNYLPEKVLVGDWVDGREFYPEREMPPDWELDPRAPALRDIAVFDFVIANHDRHTANVMVGSDGTVHAVDHGRSLGFPGEIGDRGLMPKTPSPLTDAQKKFLGQVSGMSVSELVSAGFTEGQAQTLTSRAGWLLDRGHLPTQEDYTAALEEGLSEAVLVEHGSHNQLEHGNWAHRRFRAAAGGGASLLGGPITDVEPLGGRGMNWSGIGKVNGRRVFVKAMHRPELEVAAARLNEIGGGLIDTPNCVVAPPGPIGGVNRGACVVQDLVPPGYKDWYNVEGKHGAPDWMGKASDEAKNDINVFDFVIANSDRHKGNLKINKDGHLVAIDHGLAFHAPYTPREYLLPKHHVPLTGRQKEWLKQVAGPAGAKDAGWQVRDERAKLLATATGLKIDEARGVVDRAHDLLVFGRVPTYEDISAHEGWWGTGGKFPPVSTASQQTLSSLGPAFVNNKGEAPIIKIGEAILAYRARVDGLSNLTRLLEHPGHSPQSVHGHRGVDRSGKQPISEVVREQDFLNGLNARHGVFNGGFTSAQQMAILSYQGDGFRSMNKALRTGSPLDPEDAKRAALLDRAFNRAKPLADGLIVRRSYGDNDPPQGRWVDRGFVSTAATEEGFRGVGVAKGYEVEVPAGTKAIFLPGPDDELLLPRGLTFERSGDRVRVVSGVSEALLREHGSHDQSEHGNWARGRMSDVAGPTGPAWGALNVYKGAFSPDFNGLLRDGLKWATPEHRASVRRDIEAIDAAMTPLPKKMTLYRGTDLDEFPGTDTQEALRFDDYEQGIYEQLRVKVGETYTQPGYTSTAPAAYDNVYYIHRPVRMKIVAPKGTRAIRPPDDGFEPEVLLDRGTTYKIRSVSMEEFGPYKPGRSVVNVEVEVVGQSRGTIPEAVLMEHPGHPNQKVHGRRGGVAKASIDDLVGGPDAQGERLKDTAAMGLAMELDTPEANRAIAYAGDLGEVISMGGGDAAARAERDWQTQYYASHPGLQAAIDKFDRAEGPLTNEELQEIVTYDQQRNSAGWAARRAMLNDFGSMTPEERLAALNSPDGKYIRYALASGIHHQWAATASDDHPRAIAYQWAAAAEFGLGQRVANRAGPYDRQVANPTVTPTMMNRGFGPIGHQLIHAEAAQFYEANAPALRVVARATYNRTQRALTNAGITEVEVVRGVGRLPPEVPKHDPSGLGIPIMRDDSWTGKTRLNPLSSWTTDLGVARGFGQVIVKAKVPAKYVYSTPLFGAGCAEESEVILLGGEYNVTVERGWF